MVADLLQQTSVSLFSCVVCVLHSILTLEHGRWTNEPWIMEFQNCIVLSDFTNIQPLYGKDRVAGENTVWWRMVPPYCDC